MTGDVDRLSAQVADLTAVVVGLGSLADKVSVLSARVTELTADRVLTGGTSWFEVPVEHAGPVLRDLASWVDTVLWNYRTVENQLSDCWYRHPAVVEALLALKHAWLAAYATAAPAPTSAVDWHHRFLPGTAEILRDELRGCSELNHRPGGGLASNLRPEDRTLTAAATLDAYATAWAESRRHTA